MKGKRDKDGNAQAACPQFESQTISKAISKVTISGPEAPGDEDGLVALTHLTLSSALPTPLSHFSSFSLTLKQVFRLVAGEDEDDVKSIRSHRIKMEISGHSLEESMEECRVEEMSIHKVRWNFWTVRHLLIHFIPIFTIFFPTFHFYLLLLQSHYKDALQDGLQDSHLERHSPESDDRDSVMESCGSSCDSRCSKSTMCSVS